MIRRYFPIVLAVSALLMLLTLVKPLTFDNALYQTMADQLYHFGKTPYIGTWDQNFPGIVYIHYIAIALFGNSEIGLRLFDIAVQLLFVTFLYLFWKRWLRPQTAAIAAILYVAYYVSAGGLLLSQRDVYAGMLLMLCLDAIIRSRESKYPWRWAIIAGLLSGLTLLLRPTSVAWIAIFVVALLLSNPVGLWRSRMTMAAIVVLCLLIPFTIWILCYSQIPGGLREFYDSTIRWNLDLYAPLDNGIGLLIQQFARRALLTPLILFGLVRWRTISKLFGNIPNRFEYGLYGALALSSLLIALLMRKYFDYHFAPFFILMIPVAALVIESLASSFRNRGLRVTYTIALIYMSTMIVYPTHLLATYCTAIVQGRDARHVTYLAAYPDSASGALPEQATIDYLNRAENRAKSVQVCSFRMNLQSHLYREVPTRYIDLFPLAYRLRTKSNGEPEYTEYQKKWQRGFVDSIAAKKVDLIIMLRHTPAIDLNDVYDDCLHWIPGFDSLLHAVYNYDTAFGGYEIYARK